MADIFISYAREDLATAERLAQALIAYGWSVWWDRHIPAGRRFDEVIAEQLPSAGCVLVLWSRNVIGSEWVMEEAETARTNGALVPVLIEAVQPPMGFRRIHAADLIGWDGTISHPGFERLLIDISSVIGRQQHQRAIADLQPLLEPALEPVPPLELEKLASMRPVTPTTGAPGVGGGETEGVVAADDGAVALDSSASASCAVEAAWNAATVQAIENDLMHFIGPIAKVVVSRAMQDATDLESVCTAVARSIPLDTDREQFLIRARNLEHPRPLFTVSSGGNASRPSFGFARRCPHPLIADINLHEIEQALARHIGPIAKIILKRAMTQNSTRGELCEHLATHLEREDERRQFLAAISRWV